MRCRVCFDEVEAKALVCPRCGEATDYFRSLSRLKLWLRLIGYLGTFLAIFLVLLKFLVLHR